MATVQYEYESTADFRKQIDGGFPSLHLSIDRNNYADDISNEKRFEIFLVRRPWINLYLPGVVEWWLAVFDSFNIDSLLLINDKDWRDMTDGQNPQSC